MGLVEIAGQTVELMLPEAAIAGDPGLGLAHRAGDEPAAAHAAVATAHHEARTLEHAQVLGYGGEGHPERLGQPTDGGLPGQGEVGEQGSPRGVGESGEGRVERVPFMLNHMVNYRPPPALVKSPGTWPWHRATD